MDRNIMRGIEMVCQHLSELYQLCEKNQIRLGGADLIRIVCKQCNQEETCPSVLTDEYDSAYHEIVRVPHADGAPVTSEGPQKQVDPIDRLKAIE